MLVYGGFVDMKGSSQDFWSLDFSELKLIFFHVEGNIIKFTLYIDNISDAGIR